MKARLAGSGLWIAVAIHWLPLPGLLGGAQLGGLYGLPELGPASELLLQHRALLLALLSLPLAGALSRGQPAGFAISLLLASDLSFAALCLLQAPLNPELQRVLAMDMLSIALLVAGWLASSLHLRAQTLRK